MKKLLLCLSWMASVFLFSACEPSDAGGSTGTGYGDAVLIPGQNLSDPERGALAYLAPDGTVEEDIWQKVNGTMLAGKPKDLYVCQGKLYIICGKSDNPQETDGGLIIADARTFKKEKTFPISEIAFDKPEGAGPEYQPYMKTPTNIAVIDEKNIFIKDAQGLFRFDSTTGKITPVEGTYHIANTIMGNGNLESKVSSRGMVVQNGKLYIASAGFWGDQSGLFEILPNTDQVNRVLELPVDLVSGLIAGDANELILAHYVRGTKRSNEITRIDPESFQVTGTVAPTKISLAPGFFDKPGISYLAPYIYLSEIEESETKVTQKMTIERVSIADGTSETVIRLQDDEPMAKCLTTNPVMDVKNKLLYVSVADNMYEGRASTSFVLVYDCSGSTPVLKQKISDKTSRASGIYFMNRY